MTDKILQPKLWHQEAPNVLHLFGKHAQALSMHKADSSIHFCIVEELGFYIRKESYPQNVKTTPFAQVTNCGFHSKLRICIHLINNHTSLHKGTEFCVRTRWEQVHKRKIDMLEAVSKLATSTHFRSFSQGSQSANGTLRGLLCLPSVLKLQLCIGKQTLPNMPTIATKK